MIYEYRNIGLYINIENYLYLKRSIGVSLQVYIEYCQLSRYTGYTVLQVVYSDKFYSDAFYSDTDLYSYS